MKHSRSPFVRGTLAVATTFFASCPLAAIAADVVSVQSHLERILNSTAPADIGVLQQDPQTFRVRVKTGLLFRVFQLEPTVTASPSEASIRAEDLGHGRWRFEASDSFMSTTNDELAGKSRKTLAKAARVELRGLFDPARDALNKLDLSYSDGTYFLAAGEDKYKLSYRSAGLSLEETTGKDRLSRSKVDVSINGFTVDVFEQAMAGQVIGRNFTYSIAAGGLNYRSLKNQIRFGDRISLHSSEGDLDYPSQSVAAMRDFEVRLSGTDITSTEGVEGMRAQQIDVMLSGKVPSDEARTGFKIEAKDLELVGPLARRFYLPFIPVNLSAKGTVSGIDFRKLYLRSNILSNVGTTLDENYLDDNFAPNREIKLNGIEGSFVRLDRSIDFKGEATIDLNAMKLAHMRMEVRSKNLDQIIAENADRARSDVVAGTLQFVMYFLKGVARPEGTTYSWTIEYKDGLTKINGASFGRF